MAWNSVFFVGDCRSTTKTWLWPVVFFVGFFGNLNEPFSRSKNHRGLIGRKVGCASLVDVISKKGSWQSPKQKKMRSQKRSAEVHSEDLLQKMLGPFLFIDPFLKIWLKQDVSSDVKNPILTSTENIKRPCALLPTYDPHRTWLQVDSSVHVPAIPLLHLFGIAGTMAVPAGVFHGITSCNKSNLTKG